MSAFRKQNSNGRPFTPGEMDNRAGGQPVYLTPASKGRMGAADAFATEASQLGDAELDMRMGYHSGGMKVFGNAAFIPDDPHEYVAKTPGAVKMNSFFEDPNTTRAGSHLDATRSHRRPSPDNTPLERSLERPERRQASITAQNRTMRRDSSGNGRKPQPSARNNGGTLVQAFDTAADDSGSIVARTRVPPPTVNRGAAINAWENELKHMIASRSRQEAVFKPAPREGLVKCYVKRVKNFFGTHASFQMHLENGDVFLLAARRRKKSKVSSYVISQDLDDLKRDTENCLAKLKANFTGTEYMLWGKSEDSKVKKGYGNEQLCINYKQASITSTGGPRTMFSVIPLPDSQWAPSAADGSDSLSNSLEAARNKELPPYLERKMAMMSTKPAEYDDSIKAYTLDFKGRVKEASVKNFQLVMWDHNTDKRSSEVLLQFGKIEDDLYALDFMYPMNIEVAFAIALASIDTKLCYSI